MHVCLILLLQEQVHEASLPSCQQLVPTPESGVAIWNAADDIVAALMSQIHRIHLPLERLIDRADAGCPPAPFFSYSSDQHMVYSVESFRRARLVNGGCVGRDNRHLGIFIQQQLLWFVVLACANNVITMYPPRGVFRGIADSESVR